MKATIEEIKIGEKKSGTGKNGKPYEMQNVGIKTGGTWYNGTIFGTNIKTVSEWKTGQEVEIETFDEVYKDKDGNEKTAKKFKLPQRSGGGISTEVIAKIDRIEKGIVEIYKLLKSLDGKTTEFIDTQLPLE